MKKPKFQRRKKGSEEKSPVTSIVGNITQSARVNESKKPMDVSNEASRDKNITVKAHCDEKHARHDFGTNIYKVGQRSVTTLAEETNSSKGIAPSNINTGRSLEQSQTVQPEKNSTTAVNNPFRKAEQQRPAKTFSTVPSEIESQSAGNYWEKRPERNLGFSSDNENNRTAVAGWNEKEQYSGGTLSTS